MFNTLYTIAGGIALAVGALGASDDFDGAELAQNAFFGPDDALEAVEEQEAATEEVLVANDVFEWDEIASKVMEMSLSGSDELTDDEKLEIAVINEEIPAENAENQEELPQITENTQSKGLSEEEFYSILEDQFNDAMEALEPEEEIADSEPLILEAIPEDLAAVEIQPEDDVNAEKALEEVQANSESKPEDIEEAAQVNEISVEYFKEMKPWVVLHGLPDILDEDMEILTNQSTNTEQPVQTEQTEQMDVDNVDVQEIPVVESILVDVPETEEAELEEKELPLFEEAEETEAEETEAEETEAVEEEAEAEETEAEETEAEETEAEETEAEETEAVEEEAEAEETEAEEADDDLIVEPLEDDATEEESNDEALLIPSLDIPPAVVTEDQRAKISAEVDALVNQSESYDGWMPRQIPVSGSVDDVQPQIKPEDDFIQDFSKQNVKESILENTGIELND